MRAIRQALVAATIVCFAFATTAPAQAIDPLLDLWVFNNNNRHGTSTNPTVNAIVSLISADVTRIRFTSTNIYVDSSDMPSYPVGPWPGNPNTVTAQNVLIRIPRTPTPATIHTVVGLGSIGILVNGSYFYNPTDAMSYNNQNIWHSVAMFSITGMDYNMGHPSPNGAYHHHSYPMGSHDQLADHGHCPSPLFGFVFDGYPIYGAYGYSDPNDAASEVVRMVSSYRVRTDIVATGLRHSLTNGGATLPVNQWGPDVNAQYVAGYFVEDYEYVAGLGTLDEYNGRFCKTPDYPNGTYAYFTTIDANGNGVYPYYVGPRYYGVVLADNTAHNVVVPAGATDHVPATAFPCVQICENPSSVSTCGGGVASFDAHGRYEVGAGYQWRRNGIAVSNGPTAWGSTLSGTTTRTLTVSGIVPDDAGSYDCVITGACESLTTDQPAILTVFAGGSGDGNASGAANGNDLQAFVATIMQGGTAGEGYCAFDMDANGAVNIEDLPILVAKLLES
jgi:hypothetical protein